MSELPELRRLVNDLHSVQAKWYNIGLQLGVDEGTLNGIQLCKDLPATALRRMLQEWRGVNPKASLAALLEALRG